MTTLPTIPPAPAVLPYPRDDGYWLIENRRAIWRPFVPAIRPGAVIVPMPAREGATFGIAPDDAKTRHITGGHFVGGQMHCGPVFGIISTPEACFEFTDNWYFGPESQA